MSWCFAGDMFHHVPSPRHHHRLQAAEVDALDVDAVPRDDAWNMRRWWNWEPLGPPEWLPEMVNCCMNG